MIAYFYCNSWYKELERICPFNIYSEDEDTCIIHSFNSKYQVLPSIGELVTFNGHPITGYLLNLFTIEEEEELTELITGSYRVVDVTYIHYFEDQEEFGTAVDILLEKLQDPISFVPTGELEEEE